MGYRSDNRNSGFRDRPRSGGFNRGGFGGARGRSGGFRDRPSSGGFGDRRREMFKVTCDKCGEQCEVPFKPTGEKPVYCSSCFKKEGNSSSNLSSGSDADSKPRNNFRESPKQSSNSSQSGSSAGISQEQFNELNSKLDKILEILDMIEFEEEGDESEEDSEDEEEVEEAK